MPERTGQYTLLNVSIYNGQPIMKLGYKYEYNDEIKGLNINLYPAIAQLISRLLTLVVSIFLHEGFGCSLTSQFNTLSQV